VKVPLDNAAPLAGAIGARVRTLRESLGLTQEKLAYESGLRSKGTLSKIESGRLLASVSVLDLLARRLGVELLDLFVDPSSERPRDALVEASRGQPDEALRAARARLAGTPVSAHQGENERPFTEGRRGEPGVVPLLGLDVAAGGWDGTRADRGTRWVRPTHAKRVPREGFVARIVGRSMEPTLTDGSWGLFTARVNPDPEGRVVIARWGGLVDADTAASYTVKRFRGELRPPGEREREGRWSRVRLTPDNPAFEPIVVEGDRLGDLSIVAELVSPLPATR
jgi:transcriptional regulator with XRE-family HTH domain